MYIPMLLLSFILLTHSNFPTITSPNFYFPLFSDTISTTNVTNFAMLTYTYKSILQLSTPNTIIFLNSIIHSIFPQSLNVVKFYSHPRLSNGTNLVVVVERYNKQNLNIQYIKIGFVYWGQNARTPIFQHHYVSISDNIIVKEYQMTNNINNSTKIFCLANSYSYCPNSHQYQFKLSCKPDQNQSKKLFIQKNQGWQIDIIIIAVNLRSPNKIIKFMMISSKQNMTNRVEDIEIGNQYHMLIIGLKGFKFDISSKWNTQIINDSIVTMKNSLQQYVQYEYLYISSSQIPNIKLVNHIHIKQKNKYLLTYETQIKNSQLLFQFNTTSLQLSSKHTQLNNMINYTFLYLDTLQDSILTINLIYKTHQNVIWHINYTFEHIQAQSFDKQIFHSNSKHITNVCIFLQVLYLFGFMLSLFNVKNKIIGIQLITFLQFVFYSMIILPSNTLFSPFASLKYSRGININYVEEEESQYFQYGLSTNLLQNCNLMMCLIALPSVISVIFFVTSMYSKDALIKKQLKKIGYVLLIEITYLFVLFDLYNAITSLTIHVQQLGYGDIEGIMAGVLFVISSFILRRLLFYQEDRFNRKLSRKQSIDVVIFLIEMYLIPIILVLKSLFSYSFIIILAFYCFKFKFHISIKKQNERQYNVRLIWHNALQILLVIVLLVSNITIKQKGLQDYYYIIIPYLIMTILIVDLGFLSYFILKQLNRTSKILANTAMWKHLFQKRISSQQYQKQVQLKEQKKRMNIEVTRQIGSERKMEITSSKKNIFSPQQQY